MKLENGVLIPMNSETESKTKLEDSFGGTIEKNIPDDVVWIDDAFYIKETRFGLYTSILKIHLVNTLSLDQRKMQFSQCHVGILNVLQEGTLDDYTRVVNSGVVGGKL